MAAWNVILFDSTAHALRAEKVLEREGMRFKLIPTPRQLSADCGLALRFAPAERERVVALLEREGVPFNGVHDLR